MLAVTALGLALSGCGIARVVGPTADTMADWSLTPLAPDPRLAALALQAGRGALCTLDPAGGPVRILLQDRRTAATAGFLLANATSFGSCLLTTGTGGSSSGWGPPPAAMTGPLTIDDNGSGSSNSGPSLWELGGRVGPGVAGARVVLADGRQVVATVANGYWMAWWPTFGPAREVLATDLAGNQVADVQVPK